MRIECIPHAWQHSIEGDEIRAVIEYPQLRFPITTVRRPDADTYMFIGNLNDGPWIEVGAEDEDGERWVVFHAMMLKPNIAQLAYEFSGESVDLRDECPPQRAFIGPQYEKEG